MLARTQVLGGGKLELLGTVNAGSGELSQSVIDVIPNYTWLYIVGGGNRTDSGYAGIDTNTILIRSVDFMAWYNSRTYNTSVGYNLGVTFTYGNPQGILTVRPDDRTRKVKTPAFYAKDVYIYGIK